MLSTTAATQVFGQTFTLTITVSSSEPGALPEDPPVETPSTEVPTVTRSFTDPGVTVTTAPGSVTIAGKYTTILPTTWKWLDKNNVQQTGVEPPAAGTYNKLFQMDAPPTLTATCIYTISGETFTHTVTLVTYDTLRDTMMTLIAGSV